MDTEVCRMRSQNQDKMLQQFNGEIASFSRLAYLIVPDLLENMAIETFTKRVRDIELQQGLK